MRLSAFTGWLVGWGLAGGSLTGAQAQVAAPPAQTYSVKFDMVPLLASGYQLSAEKVWGPAYKQALVITPQLYRGDIQDITSNLTEGRNVVRGYGLAVQHRIYFNERTTPLEGFYVGYGPHYQHFELQFQAASWQPELAANGLTYYEFRTRNQRETVDRYGASAVLGGQFFLPATPVFVDIYLGLGLRKASSNSTVAGNRYASGMSDYGAEGHYLPVGFRLGIAL